LVYFRLPYSYWTFPLDTWFIGLVGSTKVNDYVAPRKLKNYINKYARSLSLEARQEIMVIIEKDLISRDIWFKKKPKQVEEPKAVEDSK